MVSLDHNAPAAAGPSCASRAHISGTAAGSPVVWSRKEGSEMANGGGQETAASDTSSVFGACSVHGGSGGFGRRAFLTHDSDEHRRISAREERVDYAAAKAGVGPSIGCNHEAAAGQRTSYRRTTFHSHSILELREKAARDSLSGSNSQGVVGYSDGFSGVESEFQLRERAKADGRNPRSIHAPPLLQDMEGGMRLVRERMTEGGLVTPGRRPPYASSGFRIFVEGQVEDKVLDAAAAAAHQTFGRHISLTNDPTERRAHESRGTAQSRGTSGSGDIQMHDAHEDRRAAAGDNRRRRTLSHNLTETRRLETRSESEIQTEQAAGAAPGSMMSLTAGAKYKADHGQKARGRKSTLSKSAVELRNLEFRRGENRGADSRHCQTAPVRRVALISGLGTRAVSSMNLSVAGGGDKSVRRKCTLSHSCDELQKIQRKHEPHGWNSGEGGRNTQPQRRDLKKLNITAHVQSGNQCSTQMVANGYAHPLDAYSHSPNRYARRKVVVVGGEMEPAYFPFGKPGGGAPLKDTDGTLRTSVNGRFFSDYYSVGKGRRDSELLTAMKQDLQLAERKRRETSRQDRGAHHDTPPPPLGLTDKMMESKRKGEPYNRHRITSDVTRKQLGLREHDPAVSREYLQQLDRQLQLRDQQRRNQQHRDLLEGTKHGPTVNCLFGEDSRTSQTGSHQRANGNRRSRLLDSDVFPAGSDHPSQAGLQTNHRRRSQSLSQDGRRSRNADQGTYRLLAPFATSDG